MPQLRAALVCNTRGGPRDVHLTQARAGGDASPERAAARRGRPARTPSSCAVRDPLSCEASRSLPPSARLGRATPEDQTPLRPGHVIAPPTVADCRPACRRTAIEAAAFGFSTRVGPISCFSRAKRKRRASVLSSSGGGIRTRDLRVMRSPGTRHLSLRPHNTVAEVLSDQPMSAQHGTTNGTMVPGDV